MPTVRYVEANGQAHSIDVPEGENVMRGAVYGGLAGIVGECGGGLSCATCHVYVDDAWRDRAGAPSGTDEIELLASAAAEVKASSRLSCQIVMSPALDGLVVHLPDTQF